MQFAVVIAVDVVAVVVVGLTSAVEVAFAVLDVVAVAAAFVTVELAVGSDIVDFAAVAIADFVDLVAFVHFAMPIERGTCCWHCWLHPIAVGVLQTQLGPGS